MVNCKERGAIAEEENCCEFLRDQVYGQSTMGSSDVLILRGREIWHSVESCCDMLLLRFN